MREAWRRQITAYLDGELSLPEQQAVADLLRRSPEAADLYRALQADAARLKALPKAALPETFAPGVIALIRRLDIKPVGVKTYTPIPSRWHITVAAGLVLAFGLGSYYLLTDMLRSLAGRRPELVWQGQERVENLHVRPGVANPTPERSPARATAWTELRALLPTREAWIAILSRCWDWARPIGEEFQLALGDSSRALLTIVGAGQGDLGPLDGPLTKPDVLTFPASTTDPLKSPFKTIEVRLPLFLDPRNLESSPLLEHLQRDSLHYLDLACQESWKALERLQAACQASGIRLRIDAEVKQVLAKKGPARYMIYLENVSPNQVARLLEALQAEEKKADDKRKGDTQFTSLMVQPLDRDGRQRLAEALGVPLSQLPPVTAKKGNAATKDGAAAPPAADGQRGTQSQGGQGSQGKGQRPDGVVLLYYPSRTWHPLSSEARQFFDHQRAWRPEAVHVVILLRPLRG
jgi:hypothetical protein